MGISIAHWLASLMWDFLPFCLLHITPLLYSIPPIVLCPWLALIYCVKVYRFEITKVWNNCLACHQGCAWFEYFCVTKMEHNQTIWFCRDELSLAILFWEDMITCLVCLKYLYFYVNIKLLSWIFRIWTFMPQSRKLHWKLC